MSNEEFYSKEDSSEVRAAFFAALGGKPDPRKTLITRREWALYKKMGYDMSQFEIWQDALSRARKEEAQRMKEERAKWNKSNRSWNEF